MSNFDFTNLPASPIPSVSEGRAFVFFFLGAWLLRPRRSPAWLIYLSIPCFLLYEGPKKAYFSFPPILRLSGSTTITNL